MTPDQLTETLNWRYVTKQFDPARTIPGETWSALEESLVLTPSSFGLQPWKFLVVTNPATREELLPHSWNQRQVVDCSHFLVFAAPTEIGEGDLDTFLERTAQVRSVPVESLEGYRGMMAGFFGGMSDDEKLAWAQRQIYLALGQVLLAAAAIGIDACPMEGFLPDEYDRILDLPAQNLRATVACAFGYRSADDKYATLPKVRFPDEAVIDRR